MLKLFATSKSDHEIMSVYVIRYVVFHKSRGIMGHLSYYVSESLAMLCFHDDDDDDDDDDDLF